MINKLHIKNFQSHKDSVLNFDKGVNLIVGTSDSGKTAIIRALRLVAWNRPTGDEYRSHWAGKAPTVVELQTDSGNITRTKGNSENRYELNGSEFNAFGTDVPKEISDVLNLNEINLQKQLDAPFLLSETPGEVAQHFNKIAHLDQIDTGLKKIQSAIRTIETDVKSGKTRLESFEKEIEKYDFIDKLEVDLEVLADVEKDLEKAYANKSKLTSLCDSIKNVSASIEKGSTILVIEPVVTDLLAEIDTIEALIEQGNNLLTLINRIKDIEADIQDAKTIAGAEAQIASTMLLIKERKEEYIQLSHLGDLVFKIKRIEIAVLDAQTKCKAAEAEFHTAMPTECPLCGTVIKKK